VLQLASKTPATIMARATARRSVDVVFVSFTVLPTLPILPLELPTNSSPMIKLIVFFDHLELSVAKESADTQEGEFPKARLLTSYRATNAARQAERSSQQLRMSPGRVTVGWSPR